MQLSHSENLRATVLEWVFGTRILFRSSISATSEDENPLQTTPSNKQHSTLPDSLARQLKERKRFTRFSTEDARLLAELRPTFSAHADEVVQAFYDHLLEFEPLRSFLADPAVVLRLRKIQKIYLISLTSGNYGKRYIEDRYRIGRTHETIGLEPQWFLGTYAFYLDLLVPLVLRHFGKDRDRAVRACNALSKLMNLDAQIVLEVYFETRQQKALERSERLAALGQLAASIAHEVRNPLAGMKGALEILGKGMEKDPARKEIMDELFAQILRLETLVRDLLTFAQPRPLNLQSVELHDLLNRVLRFVQDGLNSSDIELRRVYTRLPATIFADPQQLEQVFLNLIDNAVQAMGTGGTLTLKTRDSGGALTITFQDTGKGIPPRDIPRIFQPFFTTKHRGSGLGLSIVKKIVEAHDGNLEVESRPDRGTTVTIRLPRRESAHVS